MKTLRKLTFLIALWTLATLPGTAEACSVCYGKSDSAMAQGLNWGIFVLLGVVSTVLAGIASFFVFLARRAASLPAETPAQHSEISTKS
ncbi:MAG: hypothetical protein AB1705_23180 [Verrucomicrobiota bacterium]